MTQLEDRDKLLKKFRERMEKANVTRENLAAHIRNKFNSTIIANTIYKIETKKIKGSYDYFYQIDNALTDFEKSQKNKNNLATSVNKNSEC
jgi:hypothetical protein